MNVDNPDTNINSQHKGPKITIPEDKRYKLDGLLNELYRHLTYLTIHDNTDKYRAPECLMVGLIPRSKANTIYKISIIKEILKYGEVYTQDLSRKLIKEHKEIDANDFINACITIQEYCDGM